MILPHLLSLPKTSAKQTISTTGEWTTVYIDVTAMSEIKWISAYMYAKNGTSKVYVRNIEFVETNANV